jgi:phosphoglucosamine mutase
MLTASHNPYEDNGIKIFGPDGYKLSDALEEDVEGLLRDNDLTGPAVGAQIGKATRVDDAVGRYIEYAKQAAGAGSLDGLRVVVDCANGAGYFVGPLIFEELGAEVITLGTKPDGRNINENCGALHPEGAAEAVKTYWADIGICFDGDADRVIFCDENGKVISGDRILCLCAKALHESGKLRGGVLVSTVMSNLGLREALAEEGIALEMTGVGDRLVLERMREKGYALGGENSGHIIFADHATTGDGIMSALKVLQIMKKKGQKLSELAKCMTEYPQELISLPVRETPPVESVPLLQAAIETAEGVFNGRGRTLVRYSGTEKKIRILVECADATVVKAQAAAIAKAVEETIGV